MYRSILVPIDLAEPSSWACTLPVASALRDCFKASLSLATVVPERTLLLEAQWSTSAYRELLDVADARLGAIADTVSGPGQVQHHVETGSIWRGILRVAERVDADLILLAAHRPMMRDILLGSNSAQVVRHARCSVLVVRGEDGR